MKRSNHSSKFARQRRFLVVLPLLTLPFITLMFWAFGGGKAYSVMASPNTHAGINLKLPDANIKDDKTLNKLSFYHQAALDSAKTKAAEKLDPYWNKFSTDSNLSMNSANDYEMDANKAKVYSKLDELKKVLKKDFDLPAVAIHLHKVIPIGAIIITPWKKYCTNLLHSNFRFIL